MPYESLRARTEKLARLLSDARGTEILAELQKLSLEQAGPAPARAAAPQDPDKIVGAWQAVPTEAGTQQLRRRPLSEEELRSWADVEEVPPANGARRIVVLGESSGRGFLLDPVLTPALALQMQLDVADGDHQVVDLAHTGADLRDLMETIQQLPLMEPDVIVIYAGNNWVRSRHTLAHLDLLAAALRDGGYSAMRQAYLDRIVAPGIQRTLECLASTAQACAAEVVVVIPEFNLQNWSADPELEIPPLPPEDLSIWSERRDEAGQALAVGDTAQALHLTAEMARLDQGMSPVTGWLRAQAASAVGGSESVRDALSDSRDAVCGLLGTHTPRITAGVYKALNEAVAQYGFSSVDLTNVLRSEGPDHLPKPEHFLDYCHLSGSGIQAMAAAVADVLAGRVVGRTPPIDTLSDADRAVGDLLAAVHNSYYHQSQQRVDPLVQRAVQAAPQGRSFATDLLRLLESRGPVWASKEIRRLTQYPHAARYLAPMLSRSAENLGVWSLRKALRASVGSEIGYTDPGSTIDLLRTVEQGLIDGAFRSINHTPERAFFQAFGASSRFGFATGQWQGASVTLTYRTPAPIRAGEPVVVAVDGQVIGHAPAATKWTTCELPLPAHFIVQGVHELTVRWPCGGADFERRRDLDSQALARGEYPFVRGVQGELFELVVHMNR